MTIELEAGKLGEAISKGVNYQTTKLNKQDVIPTPCWFLPQTLICVCIDILVK